MPWLVLAVRLLSDLKFPFLQGYRYEAYFTNIHCVVLFTPRDLSRCETPVLLFYITTSYELRIQCRSLEWAERMG